MQHFLSEALHRGAWGEGERQYLHPSSNQLQNTWGEEGESALTKSRTLVSRALKKLMQWCRERTHWGEMKEVCMWIRSRVLFGKSIYEKALHALWTWMESLGVIQWKRGTAHRSLHVGWKCWGPVLLMLMTDGTDSHHGDIFSTGSASCSCRGGIMSACLVGFEHKSKKKSPLSSVLKSLGASLSLNYLKITGKMQFFKRKKLRLNVQIMF